MRILISGISGKMGQLVKSDICASKDLEYAGGFDTVETFHDQIDFDVIIDFSHFSQIKSIVDYAVKKQKPLVTATTGLLDEDFKYIKKNAKLIPIFHSNNFSYGIQVLLKALKSVLPMVEDYDIEVTEKHHRYKVDAPSGTAKTILETIKKQRPNAEFVDQYTEKRQKNQVGIHAVRGGTIVGEHEILLASEDEMITIKHEALSRQIFSQGALRAARFIKDKKSGLFHMKDLV